MQKYAKKFSIPLTVVTFTFLMLAAALVWSWPFGGADSDKPMSVDEARLLIEEGRQLDAIPRSTWKQILSPEQYDILWRKGTERPFTGDLLENKQEGVYLSAGCKIPVFKSSHKYNSGTGWPSFWEVFDENNVILKPDWSFGMRRMEVLSSCGEHLGHVFEDGPEPTGLRYCINSDALLFQPATDASKVLTAETPD